LIGKRLQPWVLKFSLAVCPILLSGAKIVAQKQSPSQNLISSDTNAVKKQKQGISGFLHHIFHRNNEKPYEDYTRNKSKNKSDSTGAKNNHTPEPFELTKGSLNWTSLYARGVNPNTGISGLFSIGRLSQGFDIYGVPLSGVGIGVFNNGQFERSYSGYSVNFDAQAYMNGLRKRAENILLNKKAVGKAPNLSDSLNEFESLRKKILSPSYQSDESMCKSQFQRKDDSAKKHPDSDTTELHSLRKKLGSFEQLEKRYQQLLSVKKNFSNLQKADTAGKNYEKDDKLLSNPDNVEKLLLENHQLSGFEKFLMGVQKFSVGQSGEEISEFTLHDFMMNGINIGYKAGDMYDYVGYGKEVAVVNPFLMTGISVPNYNRTIEFVRTGEGPEDGSNFYATVVKIVDPGSATSLNETNWLFDLTKQVSFGKNVAFQAEFAKSSFTYVPGKIDSAALPFTPQNNNTLAYALRGKGLIPGSNTLIKTEFSETGGDYVTLGNPYLISGVTKYEVEISQPIGQKIYADVGGTHIIENQSNYDGVKQTDNWIQFSVRYKPTHLINLEFKYAPRQFQQEAGMVYANSTTSNINQISLTGNMSSKIVGKDATTSIFVGNFQYNTTDVSQLLSQNLNLSYYMVGQLFLLSPTQGINISINESRNNWTGNLSQFIAQSTYNWSLKKSLLVALGPEWVEQPGIIPNEAGIFSSLSGSVQKWGRIGVQLTYRNNIEKPFSNLPEYLISGSVSILW
jgi:hypothetical protein